MSHSVVYTLADIAIRLNTPGVVKTLKSFEPFVGESGALTFTVDVEAVEQLPEFRTPPVFENLFFSVFVEDGTYVRRYHDHKYGDRVYAVSRLLPDEKREVIQYLNGEDLSFSESQSCFSHIALEELLLACDRLILHASFIRTQFGGILFSGPSGIGKSTQADLWIRHEQARLINGDRSIVHRSGDRWLAHGSPYAGSSDCYVQENCSLAAIVMLEQSPVCRISRLSVPAAFQKLYAGTTVNSWNSGYVEKTCTLLSDLACAVPVYHLACTPDHEAVNVLKDVLQKEIK